MYKPLRYILFFGILLGLILAAGWLFTPHNYDPDTCDKDITKNWLGEPDHSIDMVVCGDSECYTSLNPNLFKGKTGVSTFLCSSSGMRLTECYLVLQEVLKTQSPKYLLMETDMIFLDSSLFGEVKNAFVFEMEGLLDFFRYHGRWKYLTPEVILGLTGTTDPLKGFRVYTKVNPYDGTPYMIESDVCQKMNPVNRFYLDQIKKLCDENGITLVLMSSPSPKNWTYEKHNTTAAWAAENGVNFYDLNLAVDEVGLNWQTDELDGGDHINFFGAYKTTVYMANKFKEEIL